MHKQFLPKVCTQRSLAIFPSLRSVDPVDPETLLNILENPEDREILINVIDSNDNSLGTMSLADAKKMALAKCLRLVQINAEGSHPVPLYRLQASVSKRNEKSQKREVKHKVLRLHASISEHDLTVKIKHLLDMLSKGCVVRVEVSGSKVSEFNAQHLIGKIKTELNGKAKFGPAQGTTHHAVIVLTPHELS
ncbi:translation initiation factor IF 3 [Trichuris trichiura]|uniref:Translation initiation factor IF 3 n=1 Tax=Trichuris trichiura TaxID=36087 RepID=A0A077ZIP2_TRITR|nr:translation initiation factor IF 3 [Trichuris trichiura]